MVFVELIRRISGERCSDAVALDEKFVVTSSATVDDEISIAESTTNTPHPNAAPMHSQPLVSMQTCIDISLSRRNGLDCVAKFEVLQVSLENSIV